MCVPYLLFYEAFIFVLEKCSVSAPLHKCTLQTCLCGQCVFSWSHKKNKKKIIFLLNNFFNCFLYSQHFCWYNMFTDRVREKNPNSFDHKYPEKITMAMVHDYLLKQQRYKTNTTIPVTIHLYNRKVTLPMAVRQTFTLYSVYS